MAQQLLQHFRPFLEKQREQIRRSVYGPLDVGDPLEADRAIQAWQAWHLLDRIERDLRKQVEKAVALGPIPMTKDPINAHR